MLDLFYLFCFLSVRLSLTFTTKISKVVWTSLSYLLKFSFLIVFPLFSPTVGTSHYSCILSLALQYTVFWPTLVYTNLQKQNPMFWILALIHLSGYTILTLLSNQRTELYLLHYCMPKVKYRSYSILRISVNIYWTQMFNLFHCSWFSSFEKHRNLPFTHQIWLGSSQHLLSKRCFLSYSCLDNVCHVELLQPIRAIPITLPLK